MQLHAIGENSVDVCGPANQNNELKGAQIFCIELRGISSRAMSLKLYVSLLNCSDADQGDHKQQYSLHNAT